MVSIVNLHISPSIDGRLRYGDVAEPSADVTAAQDVASDLDNAVGSTFSLDISTLFTGTDKSNGTYAFVATNGSLASLGLAFSSPNISGGSPTSGAVSGQAKWTSNFDANDVRLTNVFTLSFAALGTGDTVAPTKVINVAAQRSGANVILTHDPSSDPHGASAAGSGIDKYEVLLGATVVHTDSAVAAEPSPDWLAADIGALAVAGSSSISGAAGEASSAGWIGENAAPNAGIDKFRAFRYALSGGDFSLSMRVASITQGLASTNAKAGLMCRFGLEADDPFVFVQMRASGALRLEYRSVKGGARTTVGTAALPSATGWLKLQLVGSTFTAYAGDGPNSLGVIGSVTLAPPAQVYLMGAICGTSDTGVASCTYDNFSFTTGPAISHTFASSSTGPFIVRATDNSANVGALSDGVTVAAQTGGLFPGTSLKLFPGFMLTGFENTSAATWETYWQNFFTASPNRKAAYRPPGVYGIIKARFWMFRLYTNQNVRPSNPLNHADAGYNWAPLDAIFAINAVQNEGALVGIDIGDVRDAANTLPQWLVNAPYDGVFIDNLQRRQPKYYRYSGPDLRVPPQSNVGASPYILDEYVAFHSALHDHLVATGNINKVAWVGVGEVFTQQPLKKSDNATALPDYDETAFFHGTGLRYKLIGQIWAQHGIFLSASSQLTSDKKTINWTYMQDPIVGLGYPDLKMNNLSALTGDSRFDDLNGIYQKDIRQLFQNNEDIGIRTQLYLTPGVPNPYGKSDVSIPLTPTEIVWALGGAPKGTNKNAGLGGVGDDPPGPWPVHIIGVPMSEMGTVEGQQPPTLAAWHAAFDRLGPPGTFAFPYWPAGYTP